MNVRWAPTAREELTKIWVRADSAKRRAITSAAHAIDVRLAGDPDSEGESRAAGERVLFERPLGVVFQVQPDRSAVRVLRVWTFR